MADDQAQTGAQKLVGDFAPKLGTLTDDVLFGDVWKREGLSPRDRSLVAIAALIAGGNTEQLSAHLGIGVDTGSPRTRSVRPSPT